MKVNRFKGHKGIALNLATATAVKARNLLLRILSYNQALSHLILISDYAFQSGVDIDYLKSRSIDAKKNNIAVKPSSHSLLNWLSFNKKRTKNFIQFFHEVPLYHH